jgi:hypothetical protein
LKPRENALYDQKPTAKTPRVGMGLEKGVIPAWNETKADGLRPNGHPFKFEKSTVFMRKDVFLILTLESTPMISTLKLPFVHWAEIWRRDVERKLFQGWIMNCEE